MVGQGIEPGTIKNNDRGRYSMGIILFRYTGLKPFAVGHLRPEFYSDLDYKFKTRGP